MKVLVTGAAGNLGSAVCKVLTERGHELRATDLKHRAGLAVRIDYADMRDELSVYRLLDGCDAVVHLANHPNPNAGPTPAALLSENVAMNSNVFTAALELGVARIVFSSTVQVMCTFSWPREPRSSYPLPYLPLDGSCPASPATNPYALSKYFAEEFLRLAAKGRPELACTVLRFPFLVGDWYRRRFLSSGGVAKLSRQWVDLGELTSHLVMEDAAELIALALERQRPGYHQYFPAQTMDLAGYDLARMVRDFYPDVPLRRPVEELQTLIDLTAVQDQLGWSPRERIRAEIID